MAKEKVNLGLPFLFILYFYLFLYRKKISLDKMGGLDRLLDRLIHNKKRVNHVFKNKRNEEKGIK